MPTGGERTCASPPQYNLSGIVPRKFLVLVGPFCLNPPNDQASETVEAGHLRTTTMRSS